MCLSYSLTWALRCEIAEGSELSQIILCTLAIFFFLHKKDNCDLYLLHKDLKVFKITIEEYC